MPLTTTVLLVLALYGVQIFLQETSHFKFSFRGIVGNRDAPPEMSVLAARLHRAKNNLLEALPVFLTLAVLSLLRGQETSSAALIFFFARVAYVPAYVSGVPWLRSLIWLVGTAGLVTMAMSLCLGVDELVG